MGKGVGSCERSGLALPLLAQPPSSAPLEGKADERALWERIRSETDLDRLRAHLHGARSYVEEVLILHRMRQLQMADDLMAVPEKLDQEIHRLEGKLGDLRAQLTPQAIDETLARKADELAIQRLLGPSAHWRNQACRQAAERHPRLRKLRRRQRELELEAKHLNELIAEAERHHARLVGRPYTPDKLTSLERLQELLTEHLDEIYEQQEDVSNEILRAYEELLGPCETDDNGDQVYKGGQLDVDEICRDYVDNYIHENWDRYNAELARVRQDLERHHRQLLEGQIADLERQLRHCRTLKDASGPFRHQLMRYEPTFEAQRLDEAFEQRVREQTATPHPVFLTGSALQDGVLYCEYAPELVEKTYYSACLHFDSSVDDDPSQVPAAPSDVSAYDWLTDWAYFCIPDDEARIEFAGDAPTNDDIRAFFLEHTLLIHKACEQDPQLFEECCQTVRHRLTDHKRRRVREPSGRYRVVSSATLPERHDRKLAEQLLRRGAEVVEHEVDLPDYESWAKIKPGKRLRLDLGDGAVLWYVPHRGRRIDGKAFSQTAPFSERGRLVIEGASPRQAVEHLKALGLCEGVCQQVPYELVMRSPTRRSGLVSPKHRAYASGESRLELPPGHAVLHTMTGAPTADHAEQRLEHIIESGGLKSLAQRRRAGRRVRTLSPLGDIASGLDWGVPCSIGTTSDYGGRITFVMRPEVLERRDLWFAPRDFGGGHDRYEQYTEYAKSLGQGKIHRPCPPEGRAEHLRSGVRKPDNEVWLAGEVNLDEIQAIVVDDPELFERLRKKVPQWKRQGKLPERIELHYADGDGELADTVAELAGQMQANRHVLD